MGSGCTDGNARTWSCVGDNGGVYGGVGNTPAGGPAGEAVDMNCRLALEGNKKRERTKVWIGGKWSRTREGLQESSSCRPQGRVLGRREQNSNQTLEFRAT